MDIPLLSGVTADETAEFRSSLPINLEPVVLDTKISDGQLRATSGTTPFAVGPGIDRGAILWKDLCFRVMGTKLVSINQFGEATVIGDVGEDSGGAGYVAMDYSFDRLGIASGGKLWYYDGMTLSQVTDEDLGTVVDMLWVDGYFMTTDGTYVQVTELSDPFEVKPLKYGSAEEDPDPITGLVKFREEVYVIGRHTIQVFQNVGGNGFPFATISGATIPFGCVSPSAKTLFAESIAFVGSTRNEALRVYVAGQGTANPISTRRIDDELAAVADPTSIVLENRSTRAEQRLFVHLPDKSLVFMAQASKKAGEPIWYVAQSAAAQPYRMRNAVECFGKTLVGDLNSATVGVLTDASVTHFGDAAQWQFDTGFVYGEGEDAVIETLELTGLPGRGEPGRIFMSYTRDGENWSMERAIATGATGQRGKRLQWRPRLQLRNYMGFRFRGYDKAFPGFAALKAGIE